MNGRLDCFAVRRLCHLAFVCALSFLISPLASAQTSSICSWANSSGDYGATCSESISWVQANRCLSTSSITYSPFFRVQSNGDNHTLIYDGTVGGFRVSDGAYRSCGTWPTCRITCAPGQVPTDQIWEPEPEVPEECRDTETVGNVVVAQGVPPGCSGDCAIEAIESEPAQVVIGSNGREYTFQRYTFTHTGEACDVGSGEGSAEGVFSFDGDGLGLAVPSTVGTSEVFPPEVPVPLRVVDPPATRSGGCLPGSDSSTVCTNPHSPPPPPSRPVATWSVASPSPSGPVGRSGVVYAPRPAGDTGGDTGGSTGTGETGSGSGSAGRGQASAGCSAPPYCSDGFSIECAILRQQWTAMCKGPEAFSPAAVAASAGLEPSSPSMIGEDVVSFDPEDYDDSFLGSAVCEPLSVPVLGETIQISAHCDFLPWLKPLLLISAALVAFRILSS